MQVSLEELKSRVDKTASCRFNASNRLKSHNKLSLSVVILFSLGLIFVSLANALKLPLSAAPQSLNLMSIFLSVVILVISTVLSKSDFGVKAGRFHDCGRELNALLMKINKAIAHSNLHTEQKYDELQSAYDLILSKYENHKPVDFYYVKARWTNTYEKKWYRLPLALFCSFVEYFIYIALLLIQAIWLYLTFAA